jgi:hypothetical protein
VVVDLQELADDYPIGHIKAAIFVILLACTAISGASWLWA